MTYNNMSQHPDAMEFEQDVSKSQRKRDHHALQHFAVQLVSLTPSEWAALQLSPATIRALEETSRIHDRRALKRHYKRIANCLARETTLDPLQELLTHREQYHQQERIRQHIAEQWRDQLIAQGDEQVNVWMSQYPQTDRNHLRTLVKIAIRDRARQQTAGPRRLFRFLIAVVDTADHDRPSN
jgi:ribosome-associated protein